jgi:hypothetical protein
MSINLKYFVIIVTKNDVKLAGLLLQIVMIEDFDSFPSGTVPLYQQR